MYLVLTLKILIKCWIQIGRDKAMTLLELVGMDDLLKHNKQWEKVSAGISAMELVSTEELVDDEFEDENEDLQTDKVLVSTADLEL